MSQTNPAMRIAPRLDSFGGDWTVRDYLALDLSTGAGWQKAITIFEHRIRGRFLEPIAEIEKLPYAGFAVLALDCLLIETLQQFREGVRETPYGKSEKYFVEFLTAPPLDQHFCASQAEGFYKNVRNGILHEGEVKGHWLVRNTAGLPTISPSADEHGWIVQRTKVPCLHQRSLRSLRRGAQAPREHRAARQLQKEDGFHLSIGLG